MEEFDLSKSLEELLKRTDPPNGGTLTPTTDAPTKAILTNTTEASNSISLDSILSRLSPEGQAWLTGLNRFCRRVVEYDLRTAGPKLFVGHWESVRDTLQRLERDLGPSDDWM